MGINRKQLFFISLFFFIAIVAASNLTASSLHLDENFDSYVTGLAPTNWQAQDNNLNSGDFFQTLTWNNHKVYGTSLEDDIPYYAHYDTPAALLWQDYEVQGRLYHSHKNSGLGITFYSHIPDDNDQYYRISHYPGQSGFHLTAHGTNISDGVMSADVNVQPNSWYRFRIRVETLTDRTTIHAKIWREGNAEPANWQIDAYDAYSSRIDSGTVGFWAIEAGFKAVDDLMVYSLDYPTPTLPTLEEPPASDPLAFSDWPIGLYDIALGDHGVLATTGFDTVHQFNSTQTITQATTYLNNAQSNNLQVLQNMPSAHLYESDEFWINWVQSLSTHEALLYWYLPEEPTDYGAIKRLYHIARENDSQQHPVVTYFSNTSLGGWCDAIDGILIGAFPEYSEVPRASMMARIDQSREACPGLPITAVPMLFDTNFNGSGDYPTVAEARFDAYTAVIAGAQGINWFSYYRGKDLPDLWNGVQGISQELASLKDVLTAPPIPQTIEANLLSGPDLSPPAEGEIYGSIQLLHAEYAGETYILATNLAEEPISVRFTGLSNRTDPVEVLFEARTLTVSDETFTDNFAPNDVHIYYLENYTVENHLIYLPMTVK